MSQAYRSAYDHVVGSRLAKVQRAQEVLLPLEPQLRALDSARLARALAGGVGLAGAAWMVVLACLHENEHVTYALLASSIAAVTTYFVSRVTLEVLRRRPRPAEPPRLTGRLDEDLAHLDAIDPARSLDRYLEGHRSALASLSITLPLAATSLLAPLTLHYGVVSVLGSETASGYAGWILISLMIVGHAHLALMGMSIAFGRKLARLHREEIAAMSIHTEWGKALGIAVAVSAMPGIVLMAIPPVMSALTGLAFVPLMFILARRRVLEERALTDLAEISVRVQVEEATPAVEYEPIELPLYGEAGLGGLSGRA